MHTVTFTTNLIFLVVPGLVALVAGTWLLSSFVVRHPVKMHDADFWAWLLCLVPGGFAVLMAFVMAIDAGMS